MAKPFGSSILLPKDPVAPLEAATKQYVDAAVAGGGGGGEARLIGELIMWPTATAPSSKWLVCAGALVSRTTYSSLFSLIGTTYGAGDGSTTFALPDLRTRFPVGVGTPALGATGGTWDHQHAQSSHHHGDVTSAAPQALNTGGVGHTHVVPNITSSGGHTHEDHGTSTNTSTGGTATRVHAPAHTTTGSGHTHTISDANTTGSGHTHDTSSHNHTTSVHTPSPLDMTALNPPYLAINFLIRALA